MIVGDLSADHVTVADLEHELDEVRGELATLGWGVIVDPEMYGVRKTELRQRRFAIEDELERRELIRAGDTA